MYICVCMTLPTTINTHTHTYIHTYIHKYTDLGHQIPRRPDLEEQLHGAIPIVGVGLRSP
jgi:hypothetical protein